MALMLLLLLLLLMMMMMMMLLLMMMLLFLKVPSDRQDEYTPHYASTFWKRF